MNPTLKHPYGAIIDDADSGAKGAKPVARKKFIRGSVQQNRARTHFIGTYSEYVADEKGVLRRRKKTTPLCLAHEGVKEARRRFQPILDKVNASNLIPFKVQKSTTFDAFSEIWKTHRMSKMKSSTQLTVRGHVALLQEFFGETNLRQIERADVQRYVDSWQTKGCYDNPKTIRNYLITFNLIMKEALERGFIDNLPLKPKLPKRFKTRVPCFRLGDVARLIDVSVDEIRTIFWLAAEAGLRAGEISGLRLEDLAPSWLLVQRAVWRGIVGSPKTESSIRTVAISPQLAKLLDQQKQRQVSKGHYLYVFSTKNGTPLDMNLFRRRVLHPLLAKLGIPRAGLHAFRHFSTSLLHKLGVEVKVMVERLGHSSSVNFLPRGDGAFTIDNYASTELDQHKRAVDLVGNTIEKAVNSVRLAAAKENGSGEEPPKPLYLN
jgi:integrase